MLTASSQYTYALLLKGLRACFDNWGSLIKPIVKISCSLRQLVYNGDVGVESIESVPYMLSVDLVQSAPDSLVDMIFLITTLAKA